LVKEKAEQQIQYPFPVNTRGPEYGRWQKKDDQGCQRVGGKVPAENLEKRRIPKKEEEIEEKGIDVEVVTRKEIEQQLDENDPVMGEISPFGVEQQKSVGVTKEPLSEDKAPLIVIPDIAVTRVVPPGNQVVEAAHGDMEGKEPQKYGWPDTGVPDQRNPYKTVAACNRI
jgi:hypothetical protein